MFIRESVFHIQYNIQPTDRHHQGKIHQVPLRPQTWQHVMRSLNIYDDCVTTQHTHTDKQTNTHAHLYDACLDVSNPEAVAGGKLHFGAVSIALLWLMTRRGACMVCFIYVAEVTRIKSSKRRAQRISEEANVITVQFTASAAARLCQYIRAKKRLGQ